MLKKIILVLYLNLIAAIIFAANPKLDKHIIDLIGNKRILMIGQGDLHASKRYFDIISRGVSDLSLNSHLKYIIIECSEDMQDFVDKYMKTGDLSFLIKMNLYPVQALKYNTNALITFISFIRNLNINKHTDIRIICADQSIACYDKNKNGIIDEYSESGDFPNEMDFAKYNIKRDYDVYQKVKNLAINNPDAHIVICYGNFHAQINLNKSKRISYVENSEAADDYKTIAEYLRKDFKDDFYSISISNGYDSNIIGSSSPSIFSFEYCNNVIKIPINYNYISKRTTQYDEDLYYDAPFYMGLPLHLIKSNLTITDMIDKLSGYKGEVIREKPFDRCIGGYVLLMALAYLTDNTLYFKTYEEAVIFYREWLKNNSSKIEDDYDGDINQKERIYNLKINLAIIFSGLEKNKKINIDKVALSNKYVEEIIKESLNIENITDESVQHFINLSEKMFSVSAVYGFFWYDEFFFKAFKLYLKKYKYTLSVIPVEFNDYFAF